jgi:plasmid stabilization system protein ParE
MLLFEPGASQDVTGAVDWYLHEAGPQRTQAIDAEMRRNLDLILQMPLLGATAPLACRSWPLRRYPYTLVYRVEPNVIRVVAVAQQSRKPGYWAGRR